MVDKLQRWTPYYDGMNKNDNGDWIKYNDINSDNIRNEDRYIFAGHCRMQQHDKGDWVLYSKLFI